MLVEALKTSHKFVSGQSGNPAGRPKGVPNKRDRQVDYCSSEKCANRLADRLRQYWFRRKIIIKVWAVPVIGRATDGAKITLCFGVRSNLAQVMAAREQLHRAQGNLP